MTYRVRDAVADVIGVSALCALIYGLCFWGYVLSSPAENEQRGPSPRSSPGEVVISMTASPGSIIEGSVS
jgi:hypothetical protein